MAALGIRVADRKRHREEAAGNEETGSDESGSDSDSNSTIGSNEGKSEVASLDSLMKLTKTDLEGMARKLRLTVTGTKKALAERIVEQREKSRHDGKTLKSGEAGSTDLRLWKDVLEAYAGQIKYPSVLNWASPRVLLCPPLWLIIFWIQPPSESEMFEPLGSDGHLVRSLRERWRELTKADEAQIQELSQHFQNLYQVLTATHLRVTATTDAQTIIEAWAQRNWRMMVAPALSLCRQMQANHVRSSGMAAIADRLEARSKIPLENFSADVIAMIEKALDKGTFSDGRAHNQDKNPRPNGGARVFKCFKCQKKIPIRAGLTRREAVAEHRKAC